MQLNLYLTRKYFCPKKEKQIIFQNKISPMSSDANLMRPYGKSEKKWQQ